MASYAGAALLGLLVHTYAAPFHFTLCGHRRLARTSYSSATAPSAPLCKPSTSRSASPPYSTASSRAGPSANFCECGYYEVRATLFCSFVRDRG
ncbi:hypothetical protein K438DRAFT_1842037, partial [Mycena galopus ATCC 62051]